MVTLGLPNLQGVYGAGTNGIINLDSTNGPVIVRDASTPIGTHLLRVANSTDAATIDRYFTVSASGTRARPLLEVDGTLHHLGTQLGFYGTPPIAQRADWGALADSMGGTAKNAIAAIPDPISSPLTAVLLSVDIANNVLPQIRNAISTLAARVNDIRSALSAAAGGTGLIA